MVDVESIANDAEVIICGFAFLKKDEFIKIVDLNNAHMHMLVMVSSLKRALQNFLLERTEILSFRIKVF